MVGTKEPEELTDYDMNIIGDYNIQGDLWAIMPLFERMGIRILCTFTGNASVDEIAHAHRAKLNLMHCQRSTPYICKLMEEKYGMAADTICPIGVANTDRFMDAVCDMTGAEIPYSLEQGQGRLIDAMVDVHMKTCGKRAAIFCLEIRNARRLLRMRTIAFVRCGFPVYDRVGYHRYGIMGYHGGVYLTDRITNAILEWGER